MHVSADAVADQMYGLVRGGAIPPFVYCYPPRSAYRPLDPQWTLERIWDEDLKISLSRDLNLYLHIPFCRYKCGFCNLYTIQATDQLLYDSYVDAVCQEIRRHASIIRKRRLRTLYIGGGTPSLLSTQQLERIFATVDEVCGNWRPYVDEVCIEATPDSIVGSPSKTERLIELGLTRVNMGVQSLEAAELQESGRFSAGVEVIREATSILKKQQLRNHSTDLIIGFAAQTDESWLRSVHALVDLAPETISTYFLTVRPDAWFSQIGKYSYHRSPGYYNRYSVARDIILAAGYVQETNVRYKKMGVGGYRQKVLQFRGVPVMGIGVGARTYTNTVDYITGGAHKPHASQAWDYIDEVRSGGAKLRAGFVYDDTERIRKRLALDFFDLEVQELEPYQYSKHAHLFQDVIDAAVSLGLAKVLDDTHYQLTPAGYMYRDIISWMFFSPNVIERDRLFYQELHMDNERALMQFGPDVPVSGLAMYANQAP